MSKFKIPGAISPLLGVGPDAGPGTGYPKAKRKQIK